MATLISPQTLELIRAASDIVEVIQSYVPLTKRAGANFLALCPFHKEKTPSFNVNPQRQIFHCFGCHKGGDVFEFVKAYENISFLEAVRRLAERARIPLETESSPGQARSQFLKETLLNLHEHVCQRWQALLASDPAAQIARDYLAQRGVPAEAIQLFRLGYAPDAWDDTVNWAKSKGHDLALLERAGLVVRKPGEAGHPDHWYDRFRGRLMFPIGDEQGRVIAFSGRVLNPEQEKFGGKYVNSPETPIFTKGRVCYGLDKSKRALLDTGQAVICEGQLDLIACHVGGVPNVVAPQGTALTADHCRLLKRYVNEVILCFDADTAGQNAALRALDDLLASGLAIRVALLPAPHDPDSFIKAHGGEAFRAVLTQAIGFFDYLLLRLCREHDPASDRGRTAIVRGLGEQLLKTGDAVLLDTFANKTAQRLGVGVEAVRTELKKARRPEPMRVEDEPAELTPTTDSPARPQEFWLLRVILGHENLVEEALTHLELDWVQHPAVRRLLACRFAHFTAGDSPTLPVLLTEVNDETATRLATEAASHEVDPAIAAQILLDSIRWLRDQSITLELARLTRRISDPATPAAERVAAIRQRVELRQAKMAPVHRRAPAA
jgi:DNA primase